MTGTPVFMAEREEPDLDRVREAMREHDARREREDEEPPGQPPREEAPEDDDEEEGP